MNATRRTEHATADTSRTTTDPRRDTRPGWGRSSRLGGGPGRLIGVSLGLGLLLAALLGVVAYALAALTPDAGPHRALLIGVVFAATSLPIAAAVCWGLLVDRSTIRGAVRDPEQSVESQWLTRAQAGTVTDTVVLLFLVGLPVHFAQWRPDLSLAIAALILFMAGSTAVRYLLQKRRG